MNRFEHDVNYRKGRAGEVNVIEQLLSRNYQIREYTDFKEHAQKQHKGYDLELYNEFTKEWDRADVKTNVRNGFTYVEVGVEGTKAGWFYLSKSDCILPYDLENNCCYIYDLKEMREYVEQRKSNWTLVGRQKNLYAIPITNRLIRKVF